MISELGELRELALLVVRDFYGAAADEFADHRVAGNDVVAS